ncbi:hypothetical protein [Flavobacterium ajazii]|uniref:hypothetical protein n=1 Tax=Flavobacterium ajazii TaxID=2692318 RepID=UPI0013D49B32|nr:hypothetical protein [Flavobacterium ajazii]
MTGNFKIIGIIFLLLLFNCKKNENNLIIEDGKKLVEQNINVLLDSIESFDISKIKVPPVSLKDFKNYKPIKTEQLRIKLLDSVLVKKQGKGFFEFNLDEKCLINLKSKYKTNIVKLNNHSGNVLFVSFFNFWIKNNIGVIEVKKTIGISMSHDKYYFKKKNDKWIFIRKELLNMG